MIKLRPHHIICTLCFRGEGYDQEFIQNFKIIHEKLINTNNHISIQIVDNCDDICAKCPEKQNNLCCNEAETQVLDATYLSILQLKIGQIITFNELITKIKELLTLELFQVTCKECSWYPFNLCEPIIQKLINININEHSQKTTQRRNMTKDAVSKEVYCEHRMCSAIQRLLRRKFLAMTSKSKRQGAGFCGKVVNQPCLYQCKSI